MRNIPSEIENLPIYDQILQTMKFDFEKNQIEICIERYEDSLQNYVLLKVYFIGVFRFASVYPDGVLFKPHGCYRAECKALTENEYETTWVFQIDDMPLWSVTIGFKDFYFEELCPSKILLVPDEKPD